MADKIVDVVLVVKIPADEYDWKIADLLAEIDAAARRCQVIHQEPAVLEVSDGRA